MMDKGALLLITTLLLIFPLIVSADPICSYAGPDKSDDYLQLTDFGVRAVSDIEEGGRIIVRFTLKNVGKEPINLSSKGVFAAVRLKEAENKDFGFTDGGRTLNYMDEVQFSEEFTIDEKGTWDVWPSYEYMKCSYSKPLKHTVCFAKKGPDYWHGCAFEVCPDYCDDDTRYYDAYVGQDNDCVYKEEECEYGCDGDDCKEGGLPPLEIPRTEPVEELPTFVPPGACTLCPTLEDLGPCVEQTCTGPTLSEVQHYKRETATIGCTYAGQGTTTPMIFVAENGTEGQSNLYSDFCDGRNVVEYYCTGNGVLGNQTYECPNGCQSGVCVCNDSDGGKNYFESGEAGGMPDRCVSSARLNESFCTADGPAYEQTWCLCETGECKCTDSDGGWNTYTPGHILFDPLHRRDECVNSRTLREYYCQNNRVVNRSVNCPCDGGACICGDSDGGVNAYVYGETSGGSKDRCFDDKHLQEFLVVFNETSGVCEAFYTNITCPGACDRTAGVCMPTCYDEIQNQGEEGIDCGGPCSIGCSDCFHLYCGGVPYECTGQLVEWSGQDSWRFSLDEPRVREVAEEALLEYANCLRDPDCRWRLPRVTHFDDYSRVTVADLELNSDAIMEAVAYYVDKHIYYIPDPDDVVENGCDIEDDLHAQSAIYTIEESGATECPKDYCGDCEDHAILREALMRVLGIPEDCAYCADHYDSYWGYGHTFNIVNYRNKWRIMDYEPLGSKFLTDWSEHNPQNIWNDAVGELYCPDWRDNLGDGNLDCGCEKTSPRSRTWNYVRGSHCPTSWDGFKTYRTDVCP